MKPVDSEWHRRRAEARREGFNVEEFSDDEIIRWDLDTAGITGEDNPLTWLWDRPVDVLGTNGTDVRDLDDR